MPDTESGEHAESGNDEGYQADAVQRHQRKAQDCFFDVLTGGDQRCSAAKGHQDRGQTEQVNQVVGGHAHRFLPFLRIALHAGRDSNPEQAADGFDSTFKTREGLQSQASQLFVLFVQNGVAVVGGVELLRQIKAVAGHE